MIIRNGQDVKAERVRRGVTQADLARRLELFESTMVDIERDKVQLSRDQYRQIGRVMEEQVESDLMTEAAG